MSTAVHPRILDRPAEVGDRVNCGQRGGWLSLIGTVIDTCDVTGQLRIREEATGLLVYVQPSTALVIAPRIRQLAACPTCGNELLGLLATCRKPECLRADLDAEAAFKRGEDL